MSCVLPRLDVVRRLRPVDLLAPGTAVDRDAGVAAMPAVAPYVAATGAAHDGAAVALHLAGVRLAASWAGGSMSLVVGGRELRSRRFHRAESPDRIGVIAWSFAATASNASAQVAAWSLPFTRMKGRSSRWRDRPSTA